MSPKLVPVKGEVLILSVSCAASSQTRSARDTDTGVVWVDGGGVVVCSVYFSSPVS